MKSRAYFSSKDIWNFSNSSWYSCRNVVLPWCSSWLIIYLTTLPICEWEYENTPYPSCQWNFRRPLAWVLTHLDELRLIVHTMLAIEWFFDNTKSKCTWSETPPTCNVGHWFSFSVLPDTNAYRVVRSHRRETDIALWLRRPGESKSLTKIVTWRCSFAEIFNPFRVGTNERLGRVGCILTRRVTPG